MTALGLTLLAWVAIASDASEGRARLDGEVRRVVDAVSRQVGIGGDAIATADVNADPLNTRCPEFAVLPAAGTEQFVGHRSARRCVSDRTPDAAMLSALATEAVRARNLVTGYRAGVDDSLVYTAALPLENQRGEPVGAVVAVADAGAEQDRHVGFATLVIGGCVLVVAAVAAGAFLLARRSVGPAAAALGQQEELLDGIAHDLRNPVSALRTTAQAAQSNPAEQAGLLPTVVRLSAAMGSIIEVLLRRARLVAGIEKLDRQRLWLDQLVEGVVDDTPAGGATVTVTAAPTMVDAEPALLRRAVANLLENALRHGHQPGALSVVHITVLDGRVIVADQGPGVAESVVETMFDRFSSGGGSSGLGLSIVRWVAQVHGGTLRVYNRDEGGAIFELALPVSAP
ncbi:HAMP domain-containing histidine kinase [Amycolatopsis suaedae]|uniref:histidine kinase n=2 Tax=Amycolatopsis suaedae TaxID=2510978 RepID=A0A4Q7J2B7_9PSEU|nr:HAMP domain-containing histidine kinase [Amycolatopsis suaedae]